ncbi:predicted protein [Nematostella vectensis]|uniref:G-protein coupled receptors family 1 profile domain-containing protein n=1 Tax=Nematostella vectensis TaxID=45351 RepID=A7S178_NEMVE|nr:neuromedin-K receptor [Nematostella vectensis]EDO42552.1 predicted protein [Nematostella vectensis]|eukprot:XP_001634615.1 predicted protein [Nematostella vectensis]
MEGSEDGGIVSSSLNGTSLAYTVSANEEGMPDYATAEITLPLYTIFMLVLYTVIFIIGFFGNCIVIYGVMQQGANKTTSSFFIANLALSDLAVLVLSLPVGLLQELASWPFGEMACKIFFPLGDVFLMVSIMTLTIISLDRLRAVVTPKKRFTKGQAKVAIIVIWLLSYLICGLPMSFLLKLITLETGVKICYPYWPNTLHRRVHMMAISLLVTIPLFIIAYSYSMIVSTLWKVRIIHKNVIGLNKESFARLKQKRKLVKMLIVIIIAFTVCSMPYLIYGLYLEFAQKERDKQVEISLVVLISLLYTNSAVNPLILCAMSKDYRKGLRPCKC